MRSGLDVGIARPSSHSSPTTLPRLHQSPRRWSAGWSCGLSLQCRNCSERKLRVGPGVGSEEAHNASSLCPIALETAEAVRKGLPFAH